MAALLLARPLEAGTRLTRAAARASHSPRSLDAKTDVVPYAGEGRVCRPRCAALLLRVAVRAILRAAALESLPFSLGSPCFARIFFSISMVIAIISTNFAEIGAYNIFKKYCTPCFAPNLPSRDST